MIPTLSRRPASIPFALAGLAVVLSAGCQNPDPDHLDRLLIGEVVMHSELSENLRAICMPGGRLSGSENGRRAEQYVADKAREYGLANVHLEPFEMISWRDIDTKVTLLDDPPRVLEGALSLGNCMTTPPEGVTAEVVDLHAGKVEDFEAAGDSIRGKFVMVREGGLHRSEKMELVLEHGGAGMIQVSRLEHSPRVGQCHATPRLEPGVVITGADGEAIAKRLEAGEAVRLNVQLEAESWEATPNNVVAEIPGHGPLADEVIILSAHLDSWHLAEGAIDNGNGSSAILEAARTLAWANHRPAGERWRPRRTVRFIWFMGEEHGLHGSKAYVARHMNELDNIVAVVNADMPGEPRSFSTFEHEEIIDFLQGVRADLTGYDMDEKIHVAHWTASDHAPFMLRGVCALSLNGELGPGVKFYHSDGDKYEVVDRPATTQAAAALAVLVRRLADVPERPTVRKTPAESESAAD